MKLPRDTQPFPSSVPDDQTKTPGADLKRANEIVSATGRQLNDPPRGQPDANVNTPARGATVER